MTNHEKALKTYEEIQKRKIAKEKKNKSDADAFFVNTFYKCFKLRHDLKSYR
jgi:hypothetical protein